MANNAPNERDVSEPQIMEIIISPGHDYWVGKGESPLQYGATSVASVDCLAGRGLRGDRYAEKPSNHKGQVTFLSWQTIGEIRRQFDLPDLPATVFRRNIIVSGLNLADLVGQRFCIQGVEFEGSEECRPCHWMDRVVGEGALAFMKENFRGGLRARILSDGVLSTLKNPGD